MTSGYRHVRLRSPSNQALELGTLFIFSKEEEPSVEACGRLEYTPDAVSATSASLKSVFSRVKDSSETGKDGKDVHVMTTCFCNAHFTCIHD